MARLNESLTWMAAPAVAVMSTISSAGHAVGGDDLLPPPPDARSINQRSEYHLGLVINHYDSHLVVPVIRRGGSFYVASADLQRAGILGDNIPAGEVNVSRLPQVKAEYDGLGQRLLLTVPTDWFTTNHVRLDEAKKAITAHNSNGMLLNYDVYSHRTEGSGTQAALWHELRFFGDSGSLFMTGAARKTFGGYAEQHNGYRRYDTTFTVENEEQAVSWSIGDTISDSLSWSSSVRIAGIAWRRDFSLRPDLITYPLPIFSGETAVPSTVDVFINGYRSGSTQLQPGPFTLTNLPYANGAGDAVLVTTDALGRQVSTTVPFYVTSRLLKPGLADGAFTLGSLRRNYGIKNVDYGPVVGSGSTRYGMTNSWTAEGHIEIAESLVLGGMGSVVKLGHFGEINGALTYSDMRHQQGQQINWGYQYSGKRFNVSTQHTRRTRGFGNLAHYESLSVNNINNRPLLSLNRTTDLYSLSVNLGRYGSLGAAWIDSRRFDGGATRLQSLSWSKSLWWNSSFYMAASHAPYSGSRTLAMSLQIPFGTRDSITLNTDNSPQTGHASRISYQHAMPADGGFSWNLSRARQRQHADYRQATLGWRNNGLDLQGGVYGQPSHYTQWGQMKGALIWMDNMLFPANQVGDAFAVISTNGQPDVPVSFENQHIGKTNRDGYLLVSSVSSYYPASYRIDALNLPADRHIKETEFRVAIKRHRGYVMAFPVTQQRGASVILHDEAGQAIPVSSQVYRASEPPTVVGYDGIAWLENIDDRNVLTVVTPSGMRCSANFNAERNTSHTLLTYGPLTCKAEER